MTKQTNIEKAIEDLPIGLDGGIHWNDMRGDFLEEYFVEHIETILSCLEKCKGGEVDEWCTEINKAPSYDFSDENTCDYLVKIKGCNSGKISYAIGHFKEDGFYLNDGGELSYAFDIIAWKHIETRPKADEGA